MDCFCTSMKKMFKAGIRTRQKILASLKVITGLTSLDIFLLFFLTIFLKFFTHFISVCFDSNTSKYNNTINSTINKYIASKNNLNIFTVILK